jgi:ketosteroid isomerase-like protein
VSDNVEIVRRVFAAFEHRDAEGLRDLCAPDVIFESVTRRLVADGEPYRGHEGLHEYLRDIASVWQELRPVPDRYEEGEGGVVVATGRIYAWGAGRVIDAPAGWLWRLADGKVVYGRVFETATGALEAAGISRQA